MLSFECIKNEKSVYFLLTSAAGCYLDDVLGSIRGVVGIAAHNLVRGMLTDCLCLARILLLHIS